MKEEKSINKNLTIEQILEKDGYFIYTNVGNSMMPFLRQYKDVIEIRKKGISRCNKYDIVLYKRGKRYILHRVLKVLPNGKYIIAGDNNTFLENDITDDRILGIVTRVIRNGQMINMDNIRYKVYMHLWCDYYPIRMNYIKVKRITRAVVHKLLY